RFFSAESHPTGFWLRLRRATDRRALPPCCEQNSVVAVSALQTYCLEKPRRLANPGRLFERKCEPQQGRFAVLPAKKRNSHGQAEDVPGGNRNARITRDGAGSRATTAVTVPVDKVCQMSRS